MILKNLYKIILRGLYILFRERRLCPICGLKLTDINKTEIINIKGQLYFAHLDCIFQTHEDFSKIIDAHKKEYMLWKL